ncbi:MAG: DUF4838 domain-containing protein, partial [Clostridia bacterium]|nr:DUF4838 domain-containing protein [Clostridia bacterium]
GLMQDFGLDVSDAENTELDDILYIDCDECGGIIAGDNPRSVLLSVYEYLRQNGCRWLYPGVDGEYIPMKDIVPVKYRHKPSCRYRGQCNEGAESQQCMLETIEFTPKVGMNVYMMEFRIPTQYYQGYYEHKFNSENRAPEPITDEQVLQWKRQCEAEIAKRGLQFHDIGHGWAVDPFGIDAARCGAVIDESGISEENRSYLAMIDGKRGLFQGKPQGTNFCMSNGRAREKFVDCVLDYAEKHSNVDYLHVWLADDFNNHCECEECKARTASDWYMLLLNELDRGLTARGLPTRIVYIAYADTTWAPTELRLDNPERFMLMLAPISRKYTETLPEGRVTASPTQYVRNNIRRPRNLDEFLAEFSAWREVWHGPSVCYEYHFWRPQCFDLTGIAIARRIIEDIAVYRENGISGIIEDGSQRSFFPTGFAFYTYARALFDSSYSYDMICEDYFSTAFGEDWREFYSYFEKISEALPYGYVCGSERYGHYAPERLGAIRSVKEITRDGRELIRRHYNSKYRVQTASVRLLEHHADFCDLLASALAEKCLGNDSEAKALFEKMRLEFGSCEVAIERNYDHMLWMSFLLANIFERPTRKPEGNA